MFQNLFSTTISNFNNKITLSLKNSVENIEVNIIMRTTGASERRQELRKAGIGTLKAIGESVPNTSMGGLVPRYASDFLNQMYYKHHDGSDLNINEMFVEVSSNLPTNIDGNLKEILKKLAPNSNSELYNTKLRFLSILDFLLSGSDKYVEFRQHRNPRDTKEFIIQKLQNIVKKFSPELQRIVNDKLENDKLGAKEERLAEARIGFEFSGDESLALEKAILQALLMTREAILKKLKSGELKFEALSEELRNDKDIALMAVRHSGYNLQFVGEELKKDLNAIKDIVLKAVQKVGYYIFHLIPENLQKDNKIINVMNEARETQEKHRIGSSERKAKAKAAEATVAEEKPWPEEDSKELVRLIVPLLEQVSEHTKTSATSVTGGVSASSVLQQQVQGQR